MTDGPPPHNPGQPPASLDHAAPAADHEIAALRRQVAAQAEELRELRARVRSMERAEAEAGLGTWTFDPRSGKGWWSQHMYTLLGAAPSAEVPSNAAYLELIHPDDRELLARTMADLAQGRPPEQREFRTSPERGPVRVLRPNYFVERDEAGEPLMFVGTSLDVTERQLAREAAQEAHARLEALITSLPVGIAYLDRELRYQLINPALAQLNGLAPADHIGRALAEVLPRLSRQLEPLVRRVLATGAAVDAIELQRLPSPAEPGGRFWTAGLFPIPGPSGDAAGVGVTVTDITASRQAEAQLRQSEARFATIFERSPIALGTSRLSDGMITDVNAAFLALYGYRRDEVIGRTTAELGLWGRPEDRASVLELLRDRRHIAGVESVARTAAGEERQVLLSGELVLINDEPHALMQIIDITALKAAQHELQELNRTLEERVRQRAAEVQDLYDNAPTGYYSLDARARFVSVNQTMASWLGYSRAELLGRPFSDFILPAHRAAFAAGFEAFRERGAVRGLDGQLLRKDGSSFPVLLSATAVYDAQGAYASSRATVFDNTERRQAEEALRESEEQNRLLFEESPEAVALFDADGRIVRANRAFAQLVGRSVDELPSLSYEALGRISAAQLAQLSAEIRPSFTEAALRIRRADGEARVVEVRVFALSLRNRQHYLAGMRDITAAHQTEERLRQANAELARAARAKDEFLANMSHELRTPLNAILGYSESLSEEVYGPLSAAQQRSIASIEAGGRHLLALINDILDLAKVEAGRLELEPERVAISELCHSSLVFITEQAQKKRLRVGLQLNDQNATITADPTRLKQMLVNLLSNAVKFTPAHGLVSLEVAVDAEEQVARFTVRDTGIGIAPEDLGRLFQPFQQLDSALNRRHDGTGLGLALVRRLAELHGGSVSVQSEVGRGSSFTIALPYRPETHDPAELALDGAP